MLEKVEKASTGGEEPESQQENIQVRSAEALIILAARLNESLYRENIDFLMLYQQLIEAIKENGDVRAALEEATAYDLPGPLDMKSPQVFKDDVKNYKELNDMLSYMPECWGRDISVGEGWHPIVIGVHKKIKEIFPNYTLEQIKEKFACLEFYWRPGPGYSFFERVVPRPEPPKELAEIYANYSPNLLKIKTDPAKDPLLAAWYKELEEWWGKKEIWDAHPDNKLVNALIKERYSEAIKIIEEAREEARMTCEVYGTRDAALTRSPNGWMRALSPKAAREANAELLEQIIDLRLEDILTDTGISVDDLESKEALDKIGEYLLQQTGSETTCINISAGGNIINKDELEKNIEANMPNLFFPIAQIIGQGKVKINVI